MNKKIRVLITTSNFNTAGSGKVIYDLVKGLDPDKFEAEIACNSNKGAFFKVIESLGVPIHIFETKSPYRPFYNLLFRVWKVSKFYKRNQYDIVHSWQWSSDWTEALAARLVGVKWIYTKKAMGFDNKNWHMKSYLAHFIITINNEMRAYFPKKKQQALIPLGIDTDYYNPKVVTEPLELTTTSFHIITVANLVPVKGVQILIEAINQLQDSSVRLSILGDFNNAYGDTLVALKDRLGLQDQVEFLGKSLDVRPYFKTADLYVIPTLNEGRKEGMPMALVEAMSMGIPVLGSDITGINFVLKDFKSLLFEAGSVDDLALKIIEIKEMESLNRSKIGQCLRSYCQEHFSMNKFISEHEVLYRSIADNQ
ncbi:glycosyltransferase [Winogradskyella ludwigii]|uniref:glycosyltransferase n=1 Tax=Winogradskyella ludwigii TaxID=2686076 RepID=UPI0015C7CAE9|nr:glycosyltransferase [Winogradskyella ludwigii]